MNEAVAIPTESSLTHIPAQVAASWARAGFPVFPCRHVPEEWRGELKKAKTPLTDHGFKDATTDLQTIADWWRRFPHALVGLATGSASGLFVVDLDIDKTTGETTGEASLAALGLSHLIGTVPTVATPSGGFHLYFRDCGFRCITADKSPILGAGIDTRGDGGYIIAPGSVTPQGAYSLINGPLRLEALTGVPEAIAERLRAHEGAKLARASAPDPMQGAFRIDTGTTAYASDRALKAGESEVADIVGYISPDCGYGDWVTVLMGLHAHFGGNGAGLELADRWSSQGTKYRPGEVAEKWRGFEAGGGTSWGSVCHLARQYGADLSEISRRHRSKSETGGNARQSEAGAPAQTTAEDPPPPVTIRAFEAWKQLDPATIPRIRFVYGDAYAAGYVTVTFAAPKTGKSLLGIAEAIDATTGRGFLSGRTAEPQAVLYYNAEDDQDVLNARAWAVLGANGIPEDEVIGRFFPVSGIADDRQLVLIRGEKNEINEAAFSFLAETITRNRIALAIFDPLQDLSESPETNEAFRALGKRLRRLAHDTGVAIGIVHHTRKPSAGVQPTLDDGRGGGALRGVARFNRLLVPMTEGEGAQAGVDDFRYFFRIGEMESNLAPPSSDRNRWFQKIGVEIGNGAQYPTIRPWVWPDAFGGVTVNDARQVRAAIAKRADEGEPTRENVQANNWAGLVVAEVLGLNLAKTSDKARVKTMLRKWIDTGVLSVEKIRTEKGKDVPHIFLGPNDLSGDE